MFLIGANSAFKFKGVKKSLAFKSKHLVPYILRNLASVAVIVICACVIFDIYTSWPTQLLPGLI